MTSKPTTTKQLMFSPLKKWRREHCHKCDDQCNPTERRFLACLLSDMADAIRRNKEPNKSRDDNI